MFCFVMLLLFDYDLEVEGQLILSERHVPLAETIHKSFEGSTKDYTYILNLGNLILRVVYTQSPVLRSCSGPLNCSLRLRSRDGL